MTGSTYDAKSVLDFTKDKVQFNGQGISGEVPASTADFNIEYVLTDDHFITGAKLIITNPCPDDKIKLQIVSGNTVVNEFINWFAADMDTQLPYPAKIPAGLKIRAVYTNTCTSAVKVRVNLHLHKIMI
jgi:hypothetical protein